MTKFWRILPILLLILAFASVPPVSNAQANQSGASGQSSDVKSVPGELLKVDTDNQTLTIKNAEGDELDFRYNSDTKVEGITNGIQGLSTKTGTRVMVHYKEQSDQKIATKIEIVKSGSDK